MFAFPVTASISATKSHGLRSVVYKPSTNPKRIEDGTMKVTESIGVKVPRLVTEEYLVQETPAIGYCGREWLVVKADTRGWEGTLKGHDAAERVGNVYECRVLADGTGWCTCDGMQASKGKNLCVHFLGLKALLEVGGLPSPFENPNTDTTSTEIEDVGACDLEPFVTAATTSDQNPAHIAKQKAHEAILREWDSHARKTYSPERYAEWLQNPCPMTVAPPDQEIF